MKKFQIALLCLITGMTTLSTGAQTVDEIIGKYITALGGKEKLLSLNTIKMTGSLNAMGNEVGIVITRKHLVGSRADITIQETENYQIVTPEKGWAFMPIQGMSAPTEMPEQQFKSLQTQMDIQSPFLNYKEKGNAVEFLGTEKSDSIVCNKLKLVYRNGITTVFFISTSGNRIVKTTGKRTINGAEMDIETSYSNYKQNADGYWFAYSISSNIQGDTNLDRIETNVAVEDNIFKVN